MHGVHIGAEAVLANHCTVLDGAVIGARSLIAAHSLVVGGTKIPDEVVVTGAPAKVRGPIAGTGAEMWVNPTPARIRTWPAATCRDCGTSRSRASKPDCQLSLSQVAERSSTGMAQRAGRRMGRRECASASVTA